MAEQILKSPGVSAREIDLTQPGQVTPQGVPAGVIGTAAKGPAFVPITFATYADFKSIFGSSEGTRFGPLAVSEWMRNARAGTYVRVLGAGNAKKSNSNGTVTNAGFVVGSKQIQTNGNIGSNTLAGTAGVPGRTFFLACEMSESNGSSYFTDAGISTPSSASILRGVLMFASGVRPGLSSSIIGLQSLTASSVANDVFAGNKDGGYQLGGVDLTANGDQSFIMFLNGFTNTTVESNVLTASLNPKSPSYFGKTFNTDPTKLETKGHLLYAAYDVPPALALPTGASAKEHRLMLVSGSAARNTYNTTGGHKPNFENFEQRFSHAKTPFIISQKLGSTPKNLFRFHALDAGEVGNSAFKVSIANIAKSTDQNNLYGSFDVYIRDFNDTDADQVILEKFVNTSLDPNSDRYIARLIGDVNTFYDFDKNNGNQKLVSDGFYPNRSRYVRVQVVNDIENGVMEPTALPLGYRGIGHLVTDGTAEAILKINSGSYANHIGTGPAYLDHFVSAETKSEAIRQPPVPFRNSVATGTGNNLTADSRFYWGIQFETIDSILEPNRTSENSNLTKEYTKFFPTNGTFAVMLRDNEGTVNSSGGSVHDADAFNNNIFSLERVNVKCKSASTSNAVDPREWKNAEYIRTGVARASSATKGSANGYRFLDVEKDFAQVASRKYLKFTTLLQGGFDGLNIFNKNKVDMDTISAAREVEYSSNQGGTAGSTVAAYRKAIDILEEKSDADIQLLAIPGIRETTVSDYAIDAVEDRFDALYIMDIEQCDHNGTSFANLVSGSAQNINVQNTVEKFSARNIDTSFAASYFPDIVITDSDTGANVVVPPSVAVLGGYSLNDALSHPWFAPAGFTRGALSSASEAQVKLNRANMDELYEADVNPILAFPDSDGVVVYGQKTLLQAQSALDRVNVRRLLIDVRRKVRNVANTILFEPNREDTLAKFSNSVQPILATIQSQQGVDRYKVVIDTTTTTQQDVENNTIRGKIFLQPTRSVEFISLDFVVTNQGADI